MRADTVGDLRPKILFVIPRAVRGGAQVYVLGLLRALEGSFRLALGVGEEGFLTDSARTLGVPVTLLRGLRPGRRPWAAAAAIDEATRLVRASRADLVSAHSTVGGLVGRAAAARAGIPAVFTAHGWPFASDIPWLRRAAALQLERLAARWCERIIVVCEADRRLALGSGVASAAKLVTVRQGIPDAPERAAPAAPGVPLIAAVARLERPKDHATLLRALAALTGDWRASLVGDGPDRVRDEALAAELGIAERVRFLGWRDDVPVILAASHVFALASRGEGLPLSILEAMRAGLPVVASDVGGVGEAVADGVTGFLAPPGDPAALAMRVRTLLRDPLLRGRLGDAGRRTFERLFAHARMVEETVAVYRCALAAEAGFQDRTEPGHRAETR